jgi:antiviral helicase SKI2
MTLQNSDLTLKGILATEINEGHQILMTELYTREILHHLSGEELIIALSCFLEEKDKENAISINSVNVSHELKDIIRNIQDMSEEYKQKDFEITGNLLEGYWDISLCMVAAISEWMNGQNASVICSKYDLFEGNFIRSIMKMANIIDEWLSLATYCQHVEQINKINEIKEKLMRDIVLSDSLYLHL